MNISDAITGDSRSNRSRSNGKLTREDIDQCGLWFVIILQILFEREIGNGGVKRRSPGARLTLP